VADINECASATLNTTFLSSKKLTTLWKCEAITRDLRKIRLGRSKVLSMSVEIVVVHYLGHLFSDLRLWTSTESHI